MVGLIEGGGVGNGWEVRGGGRLWRWWCVGGKKQVVEAECERVEAGRCSVGPMCCGRLERGVVAVCGYRLSL